MGLESLEKRCLMAGNVTVVFKEDEAIITGDAKGNSITLTAGGIENDHFTVTGNEGTTVNGLAAYSIETYPVAEERFDGIVIKMGSGDDDVNIAETGQTGPASIDLGAGSDRLDIQSRNDDFTALDVFGDRGDDKIYLSTFAAQKRLRVFTGPGTDYVGMSGIEARLGFDLVDTSGRTRYTIDAVSGLRQNIITTGNSGDFLTITNSHLVSLQASLNGGNDRVSILSTFYNSASPYRRWFR